MNQMPSSESFKSILNVLTEPNAFSELQYSEIVKSVDPMLLSTLDRTIDTFGTRIIEELSSNAHLRKEIGKMRVKPHIFWGKRIGIVGLGGVGGSFLASGALAKTIFAWGLIFCKAGALNLLYSGFIFHRSNKFYEQDVQKKQKIAGVQEKMRLIIASRLEHSSKDHLVERGIQKFDLHDQAIDAHSLELVAHGKCHTTQKEETAKLETVNANQEKKLIDQEKKLIDQENKLIEQEKIIGELMKRLTSLENRG